MEPIIELEKINYKYQPDDLRPALKDVSFTIDKGEWIAIIGHNGSGKSTLAKTINGLLLPESGIVKVGNQILMKKIFGRSDRWLEWFSKSRQSVCWFDSRR